MPQCSATQPLQSVASRLSVAPPRSSCFRSASAKPPPATWPLPIPRSWPLTSPSSKDCRSRCCQSPRRTFPASSRRFHRRPACSMCGAMLPRCANRSSQSWARGTRRQQAGARPVTLHSGSPITASASPAGSRSVSTLPVMRAPWPQRGSRSPSAQPGSTASIQPPIPRSPSESPARAHWSPSFHPAPCRCPRTSPSATD